VAGTTIIVPADADPSAHLYAFDVVSGEVRWKVPFPQGIATTPILQRDRLIVLSATGTLSAIATATGETIWKGTPAGALAAMPRIPSPAAEGGRVFLGDNAQTFFAVDAADGKTIWKKDVGTRLNTSIVVAGNEVLGGTSAGILHHLSVDSGRTKRTTQLGGLPYGTLISAPPFVLILVKDDKGARLVAYDAAKGQVAWSQRTASEWTTYRPLVNGSAVIVGNEEKEICEFALADGARRRCMSVGGVPRGLGRSADGDLYVGTLSGNVLAFSSNAKP
jgi:outer membrane protein assembly factor BamB